MHNCLDTGEARPYVGSDTFYQRKVLCIAVEIPSLEVRVFHSSGRRISILAVTGAVSHPSAVTTDLEVGLRTEEGRDFRAAHHQAGERNRHRCSYTSPG
jgi:nitrogen fixation protein FixH